MSNKNDRNRLAALISLLLTGSITIGAGIIHWAQTGEVWTTIGGMLVGWPVLLIVFVNLFVSTDE